MNQGNLRIARFQARTRALGPGLRAVIWFHGCSFDCHGCIAAEMNRAPAYETTSPHELVERVAKITEIEGLTLSGGDPFDQPLQPLTIFIEEVRRRTPLSIMCYTGRTLEQLLLGTRATQHALLLQNIDILIDGLYVDALNDGAAWRGSSNQRIHFLTPRYRHLQESVLNSRNRRIEVQLDEASGLSITGIPPGGFMERLRRSFAQRGLGLETDVTEGQNT